MSGAARRVVLCVLDGFGLGDDPKRNALLAASMWNWRHITDEWPTCRLEASGIAVGLPEGQMGNSEVGHLNLGAGFPVLQDLPRINRAIADGTFATNAVLNATVDHAVQHDTRLHMLGLVGPGGIHAVDEHIVAMARLAHDRGLPAERVFLHAFTDGRDTPPRSAIEILPDLEERLGGLARIATVSGRYYAMDRDGRWERTKRAWDAIVHGIGLHAASARQAVADAYARDVSDEFIEPTVVVQDGIVANQDALIHLNFRADRARQLTQAFVLDDFRAFDRGAVPVDLAVATLTEYQSPDKLPVAVAFPPLQVDSLAAELSRRGISQLHIAETEKYAHVTYFFNGGVEVPFPGEDRILVPSNREVATYDQAPAMRAPEITDRLVEAIEARRYGFIVANYANPDMVGHTGVWDAAVEAVEVVDGCLGRLVRATLGTDAALLITADHGNIEQMRDERGAPQTKHTTSPVPLALVADGYQAAILRDGLLADVAPTVCELLDIPPGPEMTGRSLLQK